jgi:hypothetical protein
MIGVIQINIIADCGEAVPALLPRASRPQSMGKMPAGLSGRKPTPHIPSTRSGQALPMEGNKGKMPSPQSKIEKRSHYYVSYPFNFTHGRLLSPVFCILYSLFCLFGCAKPEPEQPIWEKVKIGDLAPSDAGKTQQVELLKMTKLDVHIFEIPAENIAELDKIRKKLFIRPLQLKDYKAFNANSFMVRFGQVDLWRQTNEWLIGADGRNIANVSLMLADGQAQTIVIAGLDRPQTIFYTAANGSSEGANVGPGVFGLRIKAENIPGSRGVCDLVAYPVFSPPTESTIPQLDALGKLREFPFTSAAFGLKMSPGDFVFLAPKEYVSDQTALGGLFFNNPRGGLFFSKAKAPEYKPAIRIFLLVCTGINY